MLLKELKGRGWCRLRGGTFEGAGGIAGLPQRPFFFFTERGVEGQREQEGFALQHEGM